MPYVLPDDYFKGMISLMRLPNQTQTNRHSHDFLEIVYICAGKAHYHIGDDEGELSAGDYFIVDYETDHDYRSEAGDLTLINCLFRPELIDKTFAGIRSFNELCELYMLHISGRKINGPASNQIFRDDGEIGELFFKLLYEYEHQYDGCNEMMRCILCQIILETVRRIGSQNQVSPLTAYIIGEIDSRFSEPITLGELCQARHFSLSYASARFREDTGLTFTRYLQKRRIEESCRLLRDTDRSVSQIAEAVGYTSIKFFNRVFKNIVKNTPREYRKHHN